MFAQKKQTAVDVGSIKRIKLTILDPDLHSWRDAADPHTVVFAGGGWTGLTSDFPNLLFDGVEQRRQPIQIRLEPQLKNRHFCDQVHIVMKHGPLAAFIEQAKTESMCKNCREGPRRIQALDLAEAVIPHRRRPA